MPAAPMTPNYRSFFAAFFSKKSSASELAAFRKFAAGGLLCAVLVLLSVLYIDRPVALFFSHHQAIRPFFQLLASPSLLALPFAILYLALSPFWRPPAWYAHTCLATSLAILAVTAAKDELKWAIGRPWPDTWLHYGYYRLFPFSNSDLNGCFPSGHTCYIAAPMCVLCLLFPKYRPVWLGVTFCVMAGLVGAGYHYVGDVIAGFSLGLAAAAGTVALLPKVTD